MPTTIDGMETVSKEFITMMEHGIKQERVTNIMVIDTLIHMMEQSIQFQTLELDTITHQMEQDTPELVMKELKLKVLNLECLQQRVQ